MKNIYLILAAIFLMLCVSVPTIAAAETTSEKDICDYLEQHDKVLRAQCVVYKNNCIVALKTQKFTDKTNYAAFVDDAIGYLKAKYGFENVYVTRNPKAMCAIAHISKLEENRRQELVEDLLEYFSDKFPTIHRLRMHRTV